MFGFLRSYCSNDLATDRGTSNTLSYMRGSDMAHEPIDKFGGPLSYK